MHEARAGVHAGEHAYTSLVLTCTRENSCMCLVPGCMSKNMRTRGSCWRAHRRTCVHEARAGVHTREHACTRLVLACTPENMHARVQCWHTRWRTCVHEPCAGVHAGGHACAISCWSACWRTCHVEIEGHQSGEDPEISQSNAADFGKMAASQNSRRTLTSCRHPEIERREF